MRGASERLDVQRLRAALIIDVALRRLDAVHDTQPDVGDHRRLACRTTTTSPGNKLPGAALRAAPPLRKGLEGPERMTNEGAYPLLSSPTERRME